MREGLKRGVISGQCWDTGDYGCQSCGPSRARVKIQLEVREKHFRAIKFDSAS